MSREVLGSSAHLFSIEVAEQIRYRSEKGHAGNMIFRGTNPAPGALIDFWLAGEGGEVALSVLGQDRELVARVPAPGGKGLNRVTWNLRYTDPEQGDNESPRGPLVIPGHYIVQLEVDGAVFENSLEVREDPRIQVTAEARRQWTEDLMTLGALARAVGGGVEEMGELAARVEAETGLPGGLGTWAQELVRQWGELRSRTRGLVGEVEGWVGPLTQDQLSRQSFYQEMVETLRRETLALAQQVGGTLSLESSE
jgi:hypothetical protein